jgi:hypothetical protein
MNKTLPLAAALVLLLASCGYFPARPGDPHPVRVAVRDGHIVVNQEPIYVKTKDATIIWRVPFGASFTIDAIDFTGEGRPPEGEFTCARRDDGRVFTCLDRNSRPGRYKYTIRVTQDGKALEPLDPYVVNG